MGNKKNDHDKISYSSPFCIFSGLKAHEWDVHSSMQLRYPNLDCRAVESASLVIQHTAPFMQVLIHPFANLGFASTQRARTRLSLFHFENLVHLKFQMIGCSTSESPRPHSPNSFQTLIRNLKCSKPKPQFRKIPHISHTTNPLPAAAANEV